MNPNAPGPNGKHSIIAAAKAGHYNAVGLMLDYGADSAIVDPDKYNIMTCMITGQACAIPENERLRIARLLLEYGYPFDARNGWNSTVLEDAFHHDKTKFIRLFLSFGAYEAQKRTGKPLRIRSESARELLKNTKQEFYATQTPRYAAPKNTSVPKSVPGSEKTLGVTAGDLHLAVAEGDENSVAMLVQAGADVLATDSLRKTPLHILCATKTISPEKFLKILEILISANSAALFEQDSIGRLPVHCLCERRQVSTQISALLKKDPRQANAVGGGKDKKTPLILSVCAGDSASVSLLLTAGANASAADALGKTPLHYAAENGLSDIAEILLRGSGIDVNVRDSLGRTPFLSACTIRSRYSSSSPSSSADVGKYSGSAQKKILKLLVEHGAKPKVFDRSRQTGMHLVAQFGNAETAEYLIELGLNVNARDKNGRTPHDFANYSNTRVAELLGRYGAKSGRKKRLY